MSTQCVAARKLLSAIPPHTFDRVPQPGDAPINRTCGLQTDRRSIGFNRVRADLFYVARKLLRARRHSPLRRQLAAWTAALLRERQQMKFRQMAFVSLN